MNRICDRQIATERGRMPLPLVKAKAEDRCYCFGTYNTWPIDFMGLSMISHLFDSRLRAIIETHLELTGT